MTLSSRIRQLEAQRVEAAKQARTVARLDALEAALSRKCEENIDTTE